MLASLDEMTSFEISSSWEAAHGFHAMCSQSSKGTCGVSLSHDSLTPMSGHQSGWNSIARLGAMYAPGRTEKAPLSEM